MEPSRLPRFTLPALIPAALLFLIEVLWLLFSAAESPVGLFHLGLSLGVVLLVGSVVVLLLSSPRVPAGVLPPLAAGVLALKLWMVAGTRSVILPLVVVVLPFLIVAAWLRWRGGFMGSRRSWAVVVAVVVLLSTDVLKTLWLCLSGGGTARPGWGMLMLVGLVLGLWGFLRVWPWLEDRLGGGRVFYPVILGLAVLTLGAAWWGLPDSRRTHLPGPGWTDAERPNIILISVDTLRWDMVPPRAKHLDLSNLEELRNDSIELSRGYTTASWSLPSHASLFTGRLPVEHGALNHKTVIREDVPMFSETLRRLGYWTGGFAGGILLDRHYGFDRGFDVYWNHGDSAPVFRHRDFTPGGLEILLGTLSPYRTWAPLEIQHRFRDDSPFGTPRKHRLKPNLELARRWLRTKPPRAPFFLFLHTYEVHEKRLDYDERLRKLKREHPDLARVLVDVREARGPAETRPMTESAWARFVDELPGELPERSRRRFRAFWDRTSNDVKRSLRRHGGVLSRRQQIDLQRRIAGHRRAHWKRFGQASPEERRKRVLAMIDRIYRGLGRKEYWRARRLMYGYRIENVDRRLGEFFRWLKGRNLYRKSYIVFLSDHGEGFRLEASLHGHAKGSLEEVLVRVPLWIKLPENRQGGRSLSSLVSIRDVFPVLFRHMGLEESLPDLPGENRPLVKNAPLPLPARNHVRYSIDANVYSNRNLGQEDLNMTLGVGGRRYKITRPHVLDTDAFARVFPDSLRQLRVPPDRLPREVRRQLRSAMKRYRRIHREAGERTTRELDRGLREELRGAGYL